MNVPFWTRRVGRMPYAKTPIPVTIAFVREVTPPNPIRKLLANKSMSTSYVNPITIARIMRNAWKVSVFARKGSLLKELLAWMWTNAKLGLVDLFHFAPILPVVFIASAKADT